VRHLVLIPQTLYQEEIIECDECRQHIDYCEEKFQIKRTTAHGPDPFVFDARTYSVDLCVSCAHAVLGGTTSGSRVAKTLFPQPC